MKVADVAPDAQSFGNACPEELIIKSGSRESIVKRGAFQYICDPACVAGCLMLYDLNLRTVSCSANKTDMNCGKATIDLDVESMSPENKEVLEQLISEGLAEGNKLVIPIDKNSENEEVSKAFLEVAKRFQKQDVLYGHVNLGEYLTQPISPPRIYLSDGNLYNGKNRLEVYYNAGLTRTNKIFNARQIVPVILNNNPHLVYDEKTNCLWAGDELLNKHRAFVVEKNLAKPKIKKVGNIHFL